ncbi:uncharacterized protein J3R85_010575 [Psidium guajava]|nr:uncharacterized protein J3R85_010575 [Psidium guajava]
MGEVRVITLAKVQLKECWKELCEDGGEIVRFHIGRMLPPIDIQLRFGLIHALVNFWSPKTSTLIFDKYELTPTLEEYSVLVEKSLDSRLVSPPIGEDPVLILFEFSNLS